MTMRRLTLLLVALALAAAATCASFAALAPGDYEVALTHKSLARSYLVHVPPKASEGAPLPVIVNFHGGGSNAKTQKWYTRMDAASDRDGYIAVYPNGSGGIGTRFLTWNAGSCCGVSVLNGVDDVGFTLAVLDDLARRAYVDPARVYVTGLSNGSMMAYRVAAEASERIAAAGGVAGAMTLNGFKPKVPVPVMHIHSLDDELALYTGGFGPLFPLGDTRVFHTSVEGMLKKWIAHNGCPAQGSVAALVTGAPGPDARHTANRVVHAPCRDGVEVVLWKLAGPGHVWPGGQRDFMPLLLGTSSAVIDANRELWQFFSRFRRETSSAKSGLRPAIRP